MLNAASRGVWGVEPRLAIFEFCAGLMLREPQVTLLRTFASADARGRSLCHQMLMGAGKTTVRLLARTHLPHLLHLTIRPSPLLLR